MPTPAERKALLFFAAVLALGSGVRVTGSIAERRSKPARVAAALDDQIRRVDSLRSARGRRGAVPRPRGPRRPQTATAPVDMDTASAAVIETLSGIGQTLAERIVADRDSFGAFGSLEGLTRVRGVGPALSRKLAPHVTFSRLPRPENAVNSPRRAGPAGARPGARRGGLFP